MTTEITAELSKLIQRCAQAAREADELTSALREFLSVWKQLTGSSYLELPGWGKLQKGWVWHDKIVIARPAAELVISQENIARGLLDPTRLAREILKGVDRAVEKLEAAAILAKALRRALEDERVQAELVIKAMEMEDE